MLLKPLHETSHASQHRYIFPNSFHRFDIHGHVLAFQPSLVHLIIGRYESNIHRQSRAKGFYLRGSFFRFRVPHHVFLRHDELARARRVSREGHLRGHNRHFLDRHLFEEKEEEERKKRKVWTQEIKRTGAIKRDSCANFLARFNFGREEAAFHPKRVVRSN